MLFHSRLTLMLHAHSLMPCFLIYILLPAHILKRMCNYCSYS
jgi:hypothetical protein